MEDPFMIMTFASGASGASSSTLAPSLLRFRHSRPIAKKGSLECQLLRIVFFISFLWQTELKGQAGTLFHSFVLCLVWFIAALVLCSENHALKDTSKCFWPIIK